MLPAIRPAVPADAERLADFALRAFVETFAAYNDPADMALYTAQAFGAERQRAEITAPEGGVLLAEMDGALAGYAQFRVGAAPPEVPARAPLEIARFYVDQRWHGRGVAAALMAACEAEARGRGCDALWLGVWERNARAIAFYEKNGFRRVGTMSFLLGTDMQTDHVMCRPVAPAR